MPRCTTCVAYKDECHYDKPPSLAYVRSLEEEIAELKSQLKSARTQAWLTKVRLGVDDLTTRLTCIDRLKRRQKAIVIAVTKRGILPALARTDDGLTPWLEARQMGD